MSILLQLKSIATAISGVSLRSAMIADAITMENEINNLDIVTAGLAAGVTTVWISGTTYAIGDFRRSPINFQTYRRLTNGAGTTDPSADATNWIPQAAGNASQVYSAAPAYLGEHVLRADQPRNNLNSVTATLAANAMTLAIKAGSVFNFRSTALTNGVPNTRFVPADISTVISNGSTGGTNNGVAGRIMILAIDNAGTVEVAWCNALLALNEALLISTTAEGGAGAADSAAVIYSNIARSNVPFSVVGYVDSTQTTAGTWAQTPTLVASAKNATYAINQSGGSVNATTIAASGEVDLSGSGYTAPTAANLKFKLGKISALEAYGLHLDSFSTLWTYAGSATVGAFAWMTNAIQRMRLDFLGNLSVFGGITSGGGITSSSPSAGIGYAQGAGNNVLQITSITTGVTLNTPTGKISTVSNSFTAGTYVTFVVTNSSLGTSDVIALTMAAGGLALLTAFNGGGGAFNIIIYPLVTGTYNMAFTFAVIKGSIN